MPRFAALLGLAFALCWASVGNAQQNNLNNAMQKNLALEQKGQYREAYVEWQKFLANPEIGGKNLANPNVQKVFYPSYFYYTRACYNMATLDPKIMNRQKFIDAAAGQILKVEFGTSKAGWDLTGPMYMELLKDKDSEQLKKSYDKLKLERTR